MYGPLIEWCEKEVRAISTTCFSLVLWVLISCDFQNEGEARGLR